MSALRVLFIGVSANIAPLIRSHFKDVNERVCENRDQFEMLISSGASESIHFVIAGSSFTDMPLAEMAQALRMAFQDVPVFFVAENTIGFDRTNLMKNGFKEVFLLPVDRDVMAKKLSEAAHDVEHNVFAPVRLVDIQPGTRLNFDIRIFLPANNRYLLYSAAGDELESKRLSRLKDYNHSAVYVPTTQMNEFYSYSAKRLKELTGKDGAISETERQERLYDSVRDLVTSMLSESYSKHISQGKKVVESTRRIVSEYIMLSDPADWYARLMSEIKQKRDGYSHASSVSTYAVLFSLLLRVGRPEDLAVAALFHDLGMNMISDSVQTKRFEEMNPTEKEEYKKHPSLSLELVKARKLVLPEPVMNAIAQHHERWDGSGFPSGVSYKRYSKDAQVLAIADRFDYLTRAHVSVSPLSPDQAFAQMELENVADPDLIRALKFVFERQQKAAS